MDTLYPFLNELPAGDRDNPAPPSGRRPKGPHGLERGFKESRLDKWGRWLTKTDALGQTTTYRRDSAGRLLQRDNPDDTCEAFTYTSILQAAQQKSDGTGPVCPGSG